jgi:hypothetical protein
MTGMTTTKMMKIHLKLLEAQAVLHLELVQAVQHLEVARAVLHPEVAPAVLRQALDLAVLAHQILHPKPKKKKIRVGWLNIVLMMMELNGLKMKMRHGTLENQVKPIGLSGKIR